MLNPYYLIPKVGYCPQQIDSLDIAIARSLQLLNRVQQKAVDIIGGIKGGYRREYFEKHRLGEYGPNNPLIQGLAKMGLIKVMRNGIQITTKGKNVRSPAGQPIGSRSKKASQVAKTIAEQMGGVRRLKMFLGAQVMELQGDKGLGIKFPNKQRSKGNYVEIILDRGSDTYNVTFFNLSVRAKKPVRKETGVYADMLVDMFEKQTGWMLRL